MSYFIIGVRFNKVGKIYHFDASKCPDMHVGDYAVVETSRGKQLGEVVQIGGSRLKEGQPLGILYYGRSGRKRS
jgi:cell fate regulator YaaT (PSP1 superfamily)